MIERIYILESVDPVIFYGVNNVNMQLIKTLFPKLRIVARGNVMKVIGDEEESELFLKKIREVEKYCEEFNSLSEDVILDIIKGKAPVITKQENLIIHGMNGKPIVARTENQQRLVKAFEENDLVFATGPAGTGKTFVAIALAVKALKNGAADFLLKPWDNQTLIDKVTEAYRSRKAPERTAKVDRAEGFEMLVGRSPAMLQLMKVVSKVARTDANILITGENGTGKEILAREIHRLSPRGALPMLNVDMGAISESLFESELFGHERGAFTDAHESRPGKFEAANGSSLFMDELGNLPLPLQTKLLTVLQSRNVTRLGSNKVIPVDIRLISATNKDIPEMVKQGMFREDLFYRINTVEIHIPPLRERREDIPLLVAHFAEKAAKENGIPPKTFSTEALNHLSGYEWPGNIRQLQNVVERCLVLVPGDVITLEDLPAEIRDEEAQFKSAVDLLPVQLDLADTLERIEAALIRRALVRADFVQAKAAELLGISKSLMQYKLKKYSITGH